jgi:hypothetical protein
MVLYDWLAAPLTAVGEKSEHLAASVVDRLTGA